MRMFFGALYLLYAGTIFCILMVIICPFIILDMAIVKGQLARKIAFIFLKLWAWGFSIFTFIWFQSIGEEKIATSKSYIYVGNHSSFLDAVAIVICIPQAFSPLGKVEMLKFPVFNWIYSRLVVMIDRSSRESRDQSVVALRKQLLDGQSILIFPEGTMNKTHEPLAAFFDGAFRLAIETQTPILPFAILNSKDHLPRNNPLMLKPGTVKTVFGSAVDVGGLTTDDISHLKAQVYDAILKMLAA